jgi:hypothetical protein
MKSLKYWKILSYKVLSNRKCSKKRSFSKLLRVPQNTVALKALHRAVMFFHNMMKKMKKLSKEERTALLLQVMEELECQKNRC